LRSPHDIFAAFRLFDCRIFILSSAIFGALPECATPIGTVRGRGGWVKRKASRQGDCARWPGRPRISRIARMSCSSAHPWYRC